MFGRTTVCVYLTGCMHSSNTGLLYSHTSIDNDILREEVR